MNEYLAIGTAIAKLLDALQHKIKSREDAQFFADVCSQLREIESRRRLIDFDDSRTKRILEDYFVSITEEERVLFRDGDWIFGASDALRIGIATEIGQFRMPKNCPVFPIG